MIRLALATLALAMCLSLGAETSLRIAVASNFHDTLSLLANEYTASHPDTSITLIPGSSGKLYAQIMNGAAFHAFFSADSDRPIALEKSLREQTGARFTFALGRLALWQPGSTQPDFTAARTLAIANPKLAPFGRAAAEALESLHMPPNKPRRVIAASVSQAYAYAKSGAADSALVSYSQLLQEKIPAEQFLTIDPSLYQPIDQQAIALSDDEETRSFLSYCQSDTARAHIQSAGYRLPE